MKKQREGRLAAKASQKAWLATIASERTLRGKLAAFIGYRHVAVGEILAATNDREAVCEELQSMVESGELVYLPMTGGGVAVPAFHKNAPSRY